MIKIAFKKEESIGEKIGSVAYNLFSHCFNPLPHNLNFEQPWERSLCYNIVWKMEKMLYNHSKTNFNF